MKTNYRNGIRIDKKTIIDDCYPDNKYHRVAISVEKEARGKSQIIITVTGGYFFETWCIYLRTKNYSVEVQPRFSLHPFDHELYLHRRRKTRKIVKNYTMPRDK